MALSASETLHQGCPQSGRPVGHTEPDNAASRFFFDQLAGTGKVATTDIDSGPCSGSSADHGDRCGQPQRALVALGSRLRGRPRPVKAHARFRKPTATELTKASLASLLEPPRWRFAPRHPIPTATSCTPLRFLRERSAKAPSFAFAFWMSYPVLCPSPASPFAAAWPAMFCKTARSSSPPVPKSRAMSHSCRQAVSADTAPSSCTLKPSRSRMALASFSFERWSFLHTRFQPARRVGRNHHTRLARETQQHRIWRCRWRRNDRRRGSGWPPGNACWRHRRRRNSDHTSPGQPSAGQDRTGRRPDAHAHRPGATRSRHLTRQLSFLG